MTQQNICRRFRCVPKTWAFVGKGGGGHDRGIRAAFLLPVACYNIPCTVRDRRALRTVKAFPLTPSRYGTSPSQRDAHNASCDWFIEATRVATGESLFRQRTHTQKDLNNFGAFHRCHGAQNQIDAFPPSIVFVAQRVVKQTYRVPFIPANRNVPLEKTLKTNKTVRP